MTALPPPAGCCPFAELSPLRRRHELVSSSIARLRPLHTQLPIPTFGSTSLAYICASAIGLACIVTRSRIMSVIGLSFGPTGTFSIMSSVSKPDITLRNHEPVRGQEEQYCVCGIHYVVRAVLATLHIMYNTILLCVSIIYTRVHVVKMQRMTSKPGHVNAASLRAESGALTFQR